MTLENSKITQLFEVNDNLISIGYNCFFCKFIKTKLKIKKETFFFDNIGTSMWSINELLLNDFEDFFLPINYQQIQIKNNENVNFLSNIKYYLRFKHDLTIDDFNNKGKYNGKYFTNFLTTYLRRKNRLYELLTTCKKVIFLRLEEDNIDRIIYPEYEDKLKNTEFENLLIFTEIIKKKFPNLSFNVIFISRTMETNIYTLNNIIILNTGIYKVIDWIKSHDELESIFLSNFEYIKKFIKMK
jgi:hypothetical protein